MIGTFQLFSSYTPCFDNLRVNIANGSLPIIAGKGSIKISKNIILTLVLYGPTLSCNLLSISKLTRNLEIGSHVALSSTLWRHKKQDVRFNGSLRKVQKYGSHVFLKFLNKMIIVLEKMASGYKMAPS